MPESLGNQPPGGRRLTHMRPARVCAALLLVAGAACGQAGEPVAQPVAQESPPTTAAVPTTVPGPGTAIPPASFDRPPAIYVRGGGTELVLRAWTACWSSGNVSSCADGRPPVNPPDAGSPADLEVAFDAPGWRFHATAVPTGEVCGRSQSADLTPTGPTTHRLTPIGRAGDYTITLFGKSTEAATNGGDVVTTFRWHTPKDGPNQAPGATMSLMAARPGIRVAMGAEFAAHALGVSTNSIQVTASAVVTAANGASMTVEFGPTPGLDCVADGSLSLRSAGDDGQAVAALGPPPYRYDVSLTLGGRTYRGAGTWPADEIDECSPCTRLRWDPPLPSL